MYNDGEKNEKNFVRKKKKKSTVREYITLYDVYKYRSRGKLQKNKNNYNTAAMDRYNL